MLEIKQKNGLKKEWRKVLFKKLKIWLSMALEV